MGQLLETNSQRPPAYSLMRCLCHAHPLHTRSNGPVAQLRDWNQKYTLVIPSESTQSLAIGTLDEFVGPIAFLVCHVKLSHVVAAPVIFLFFAELTVPADQHHLNE